MRTKRLSLLLSLLLIGSMLLAACGGAAEPAPAPAAPAPAEPVATEPPAAPVADRGAVAVVEEPTANPGGRHEEPTAEAQRRGSPSRSGRRQQAAAICQPQALRRRCRKSGRSRRQDPHPLVRRPGDGH